MTAVVADDKDGKEIDDGVNKVLIGKSVERKLIDEDAKDLFAENGDFVKALSGLNAATKKRATRSMAKVHRGVQSSSGKDDAKSTKLEVLDYATGYDILSVVLPPYNLHYLAKLYTLSSPHYSSVNVKVSNIVGLGFDFLESQKAKEVVEAAKTSESATKINKKIRKAKQEIVDWLDACNEEDEFIETMRKVYTDYEVMGNGYLEIGRTKTGEIGYLGHVPATSVRVRRERDGFVQVMSNKAVFFRHLGTKTEDPITGDSNPNEMIHFKKYCPTDSYYGISDILAAMGAVAGNEFASRFNLDYFENKAVPRYVIVIKGGKLSLGSQQSIVEFFETGLKGKNHRTLFVPLPADETDKKTSFEMKPVEAGTQDASFVNYNKINLQSIFMAHRVPMSKVALADNVSLAAARDADRTFKEGVCRPEQRLLEKKIAKIFKERTDIFVFKFNELTLTDEDTQSKIDERYLRMQVLVPNEVRARAGMTGLKGGDKVVDLKPQQKADAKANATESRTRDQERTGNATDSAGSTTGRQAKGDGRKTS